MRGTLFFVAAADVGWMVKLVAPRLIAQSARRRAELGLDDATLTRTNDLLARAVQDAHDAGHPAPARQTLFAMLEADGIPMNGQRGYHMLHRATFDGLLCQANAVRNEPTFIPVPPGKHMARDEAAAELARRYFTSRGPATLKDFMWWSGLLAAEARAGLDAVKSALIEETIDGKSYWRAADAPAQPPPARSVYLLPGFDEYLLGYMDRGAALDPQHAQKICPGANGVFFPTIVIDGRVVGTWKSAIKKGAAAITLSPFEGALTAAQREGVVAAAQPYGAFLARSVVV
jgi:hypothetical protein